MAAIITDLLRVKNARSFIDKIRDPANSYYTFIGLPNASEVVSSWDTSPPSPRDCFDDVNFYSTKKENHIKTFDMAGSKIEPWF